MFQCFAGVVTAIPDQTEKWKTWQAYTPQSSAGLEPMGAHTRVGALLPLTGPDLVSCVPTATAKQSHSSFSPVHTD